MLGQTCKDAVPVLKGEFGGITTPKLTAERLREVLHYDEETGVFTWLVDKGNVSAGAVAGSFNRHGYRQIRIDRVAYRAPRLAWLFMTGEWPAAEIDHKNRERADDRWNNLRTATTSQNQANTLAPATNTSGFKGTHWHKGARKWGAQIRVRGRHVHLGYFPTPELAAVAYAAAASHYFGEFARSA